MTVSETRVWGTTMKKLLLLTFIAVASEAMAQDAQCIPERAAMVEIIRAYVRSEASLLGPQGLSERVLEAVGQTERHRFIPGRSCSVAYMDGPVLIGHGQTISQPFIVAMRRRLTAMHARGIRPARWTKTKSARRADGENGPVRLDRRLL